LEAFYIHPTAQIGPDCRIGCYCLIEEEVVIGPGVEIGHHVVIHAGTRIGANTRVGDACVLGRHLTPAATSTLKKEDLPPLEIGENGILASHVIMYRGTKVGNYCFFGDFASVRENCSLGSFVLVGRGVAIENRVNIGDYSKIQTNAYITAHTTIEDHVFIGPGAKTFNDNFMGRTEKRFEYLKGPTFRRGARIGGGSIILPDINIAEESFVAAGSLVTRDTLPRKVVKGIPARIDRDVPEEEMLFPAPVCSDSSSSRTTGGEEPIPGFDLKRQNMLMLDTVMELLKDVIVKGQFILGPNLKTLESEVAQFCGVRYGIGVASGSDALYLSLLACGVGPGDEVITTPFTFFATASSIMRTGAVPVFTDIRQKTYNLDPALVASRITDRTKAILPVHLYGHPADLDPLLDIARTYRLKVIEDAAQALGAAYRGRAVGGIGDAGCISFFPTKNLGCFGDGGMVVTNDPEIAERVRMLRVHGSRRKYYHETFGCNSRLDEIQAAVLRVKLPRLPRWNEKRRALAASYVELFKASGLLESGFIRLPTEDPGCVHVYHQFTVALKERDRLQHFLKEKGIGSTVYYPLPLHLQEVFSGLGYQVGDLPAAERAAGEVLSLPLYPELKREEVVRVVEAIREFTN